MRKHAFWVLAVLAVLLMAFIGTATAETFEAPAGAEMQAATFDKVTTVTVTGIPDAVYLEQYRVTKKDPIARYALGKGPIKLNPYDGDRLQVVNSKGEWLYLTPEMSISNFPRLRLVGLAIECNNPQPSKPGCTVQIQR